MVEFNRVTFFVLCIILMVESNIRWLPAVMIPDRHFNRNDFLEIGGLLTQNFSASQRFEIHVPE